MALRWSAVAFVETEKNYRRITGYEHLWMLKAHLDRDDDNICRRSDNCVPIAADFLLPVGSGAGCKIDMIRQRYIYPLDRQ